jgi:hypothetical protein
MKKTNKPGITTLKRRPKFAYTSVCCNALAEKPACVSFGSVTTRDGLQVKTVARDKAAETQGLGSWRCTQCRKAASVTRAVFTPEARLDTVAQTV